MMRSSNKMFEVSMRLEANKINWNVSTVDKLWNRESKSMEATKDETEEDIVDESCRESKMDDLNSNGR